MNTIKHALNTLVKTIALWVGILRRFNGLAGQIASNDVRLNMLEEALGQYTRPSKSSDPKDGIASVRFYRVDHLNALCKFFGIQEDDNPVDGGPVITSSWIQDYRDSSKVINRGLHGLRTEIDRIKSVFEIKQTPDLKGDYVSETLDRIRANYAVVLAFCEQSAQYIREIGRSLGYDDERPEDDRFKRIAGIFERLAHLERECNTGGGYTDNGGDSIATRVDKLTGFAANQREDLLRFESALGGIRPRDNSEDPGPVWEFEQVERLWDTVTKLGAWKTRVSKGLDIRTTPEGALVVFKFVELAKEFDEFRDEVNNSILSVQVDVEQMRKGEGEEMPYLLRKWLEKIAKDIEAQSTE